MADQFTFETSNDSQDMSNYYKSKQFMFINDTNNANYGGTNQVTFDLTGFFNQDKFINPSEMVLVIPIISVMSCNADLSGNINDYCLSFKNGYHQLISSITVDYNGLIVQQQTTNINQYISFKRLTEMNLEKLHSEGSLYGFYPDTPLSWSYNEGISDVKGNGLRNNDNSAQHYIDVTKKYSGQTFNNGMLERQKNTCFNYDIFNGLRSESNILQELKNHTKLVIPTTVANSYQVYYTTACIKLAHISSFFENMPMTKGFMCKLTINLNLGSLKITTNGSSTVAPTKMYLKGSDINFNNGTCPLMVSPIGKGLNPGKSSEVVISCSVAKVNNSVGSNSHGNLGISNHTLNSCRVYAPIIDLTPEKRDFYESNNREKLIIWEDYYYTQLTQIPPSSTINYNVSNSIMGLKGILVIPMLSSKKHGISTDNTASPFSPCLSPFTGEPGNTSPLCIQDFNIQISGENVLNQGIKYNFELFQSQLHVVNAINGNLSKAFSQNLITLDSFEGGIHRYYYLDLSRRNNDDLSGKSLTLCGINNNLVDIDLFIYVVYNKKGILDCVSGLLKM